VANSNPSPGTRFQGGQSGNPGGKPRPKPQAAQEASLAPGPVERPPLAERVVARLAAILDDPETEANTLVRACRLLMSEDLRAAIRAMEAEPERAAKLAEYQARLDGGVAIVLSKHPDVDPDQAGLFVLECIKFQAPQTLTDYLKDYMGMWKPPALTEETIVRIWHELGLPGTPGPEPEPPPLPCGLRELPPPDQTYLAAQAVEEERRRRQSITRPNQVKPAATTPADPSGARPEPAEPPVLPAHLDSRIISFADLAIFPGLME
jgi:hypothetical protein